jgi:hypothetical protein
VVLDALPAFATGRSFAEGGAGGSFVVESVESKGMLLMVVFKQSQIANGADISLRIKNKRAESMGGDVRDREHQHERE